MIRIATFAAALAVATAARAQEAPASSLSAAVFRAAPAHASTFAQANALRAAGVARTSLDRRFDRDGATGSIGFLCGLQPSRDDSGGARARGYDPNGRFLGAKLSFAFR